MIGDLGVNSSFYRKRCSTNLYTIDLQKQQKKECQGKTDIDHVKAAALDKLIVFMNETLQSIAK